MSHTEGAPGPSPHTAALLATAVVRNADEPVTAAAGAGAIHPGAKIGRYEVCAVLAEGGMGRVFTAFDPELRRTVALKLVLPRSRAPSSRDRTRLLREAQALAKLQHANVVAIHDVGTQGEQVFIAMELVAGQTLGAWLEASARPWRVIVATFAAAGQGLAAAHAVGIVHRDFKPGNVIVGPDRVVVVDFGLACARADDVPSGATQPTASGSVLDVTLTLTNERMGTPRYMAPEQHLGGAVTPLADQFAFATSLWSALYGAAPFSGQTSAQLLDSIMRGPPSPPPDRKIPDRVRTALARALAFEPSKRWPSLAALLVELGRDPGAARRRVLAIAVVSLAILATPVTFVAARPGPEASCTAPADALWDGPQRGEVRSAFLATAESPDAEGNFARVDTALRGRITALTEAREEACAATEIRHQQSPALMDARMACLARARGQIAAFVDVLRTADAQGVARASSGAAKIGDIEECADPALLASVIPAPRDVPTALLVAELENELARIEAVGTVGRWKEALDAGRALIARIRTIDAPHLLGRALFSIGSMACDTGDPREGAEHLYEAARALASAHDDLFGAWTYVSLVRCVGVKNEDRKAGQALAEVAEAALARIGAPLELRASLYRQESAMGRVAGDLVAAFSYAQLAHMSYQLRYGDDSAETARSLAEMGLTLEMLGAYRGAVATYQRALPVLARIRGATHPRVVMYLSNLAIAASGAGDLEAAGQGFEHALALEEQNREIPGVANTLRNLASLREREGELDAAERLSLRASDVSMTVRRPDHPDFAFDMIVRATIAVDRGKLDEAQTLSERALALPMAIYGPWHPSVGDALALQAQIARRRHDFGIARGLIDRALSVHRKALGPRHPRVAADACELAALLLDIGEGGAAVTVLEEFLPLVENTHVETAPEVVTARTLLAEALLATGETGHARSVAETAVVAVGTGAHRLRGDIDGRARFALARALYDDDPARALELARQSHARLQDWPNENESLHEIERWRAAR